MKILIVDNSAMIANQCSHFTNNLNGLFLNELLENGNDLTYLQFAIHRTDNISVYNLELSGVKCIELKTYKNKLLRYLLSIPRIVRQVVLADFTYLYYPNTLRVAALLCCLLKKPYGLYIRGMNGLNDKLSLFIYKHAYTVFTVSDHFTKMVNEITNKGKAFTIRPMIPYTDADVVRDREYKSKEEYTILYLGRIAIDKGLLELLKAVDELHQRGCKIKLQVVGNGEFSTELSQMVSDLNLKNIVYLEGPVYDNVKKANYYKNADLYVLPTYHEGFPRTLYEAMIFGTPVITTFVGGIPSLMKNSENCLRIEPKSIESIVNAITYAMNHYEEMGKMAKNGSELVSRVVNRNRMSHARQLYQIIQDYGK